MPLFMDVHERLPNGITASSVEELHRKDVKVQQRRGVRYLRYWVDEGGRKLFCLVEAPNVAAAAAVHREAHGLLADRTYQVQEGRAIDGMTKEGDMSEPFIFIGSYTVQEGKVDEVRKALQELVEVVETNEPRLIAFNVYLDEEGSKVSVVQIHPDAASMGFHMKLVADHIRGAFEYFEKTLGVQIYGTPGEGTVEMIRELSQLGTPMTVMPIHEAGFTRTNAS